MDEFDFINKIKQKTYAQSSIQKGIGDDAAVFSHVNKATVTAVDAFVENVHFTERTMTPFQIGYKALAANLSDLAAMGAKPAYYLVAIVIPEHWSDSQIVEIMTGMGSLARQYQIDLIGGDTVSGTELTISVTIIGEAHPDKVRYRHVAKENDIIFVTGTLGDACAGLHMLQNKKLFKNRSYFIKRHQQPTPRNEFSLLLNDVSRVALNDVSDGLANESAEIAEASGVSFQLYDEKIPVHLDLNQFKKSHQQNCKYFGGEDFELLGTVSKIEWPKVKVAAEKTKTQVTAIGYVSEQKESSVFVHNKDKSIFKLKKKGFIHLT